MYFGWRVINCLGLDYRAQLRHSSYNEDVIGAMLYADQSHKSFLRDHSPFLSMWSDRRIAWSQWTGLGNRPTNTKEAAQKHIRPQTKMYLVSSLLSSLLFLIETITF